MFGSGTACIVCPIKNIHFDGIDIKIPLDPKDPSSEAGQLAKYFNEEILKIQYGQVPHKWSIKVD